MVGRIAFQTPRVLVHSSGAYSRPGGNLSPFWCAPEPGGDDIRTPVVRIRLRNFVVSLFVTEIAAAFEYGALIAVSLTGSKATNRKRPLTDKSIGQLSEKFPHGERPAPARPDFNRNIHHQRV
jgi:hypothetical protein